MTNSIIKKRKLPISNFLKHSELYLNKKTSYTFRFILLFPQMLYLNLMYSFTYLEFLILKNVRDLVQYAKKKFRGL